MELNSESDLPFRPLVATKKCNKDSRRIQNVTFNLDILNV